MAIPVEEKVRRIKKRTGMRRKQRRNRAVLAEHKLGTEESSSLPCYVELPREGC